MRGCGSQVLFVWVACGWLRRSEELSLGWFVGIMALVIVLDWFSAAIDREGERNRIKAAIKAAK